MKALALIDGEHYPDVVRVAFVAIPYEVVGAVLVGGSEKLRGGEDYGVPLYDTLEFEKYTSRIEDEVTSRP